MRIERIITELGGARNPDITREELEAKAAAAGVARQVVSYATSRELAVTEHDGGEWAMHSRSIPDADLHATVAPVRMESHSAVTSMGPRRSFVPRWQASASASVVNTTPPSPKKSSTTVSS